MIQIQDSNSHPDEARVMLDVTFSKDGLIEFYQKWSEVVSYDGEEEWYELGKYLVEKRWVNDYGR